MKTFVAAAAFSACVAEGKDWSADLKRARQWTPRAEYRGYGTLASANAKLNKHLKGKKGIKLKSCEEFDTQGVREVLSDLLPRVSVDLKAIYSDKDGRVGKYDTLAQMQLHWQAAPAEDLRVRDAHCHEAVMWFTHHLTTEVQEGIKGRITLPMLPAAEHTLKDASRDSADKAGIFYDSKVTCQKCHNGGIDSLGTPETKPETAKSKTKGFAAGAGKKKKKKKK